MQVPGSLVQELLVGVLVEGGQHLAVCPLGIQADGAVRAAGNHAHAAPLTAELHHVQNIKGGFMAQNAQRDTLHGAAQELKAELAAALHESYLIRRRSLHCKPGLRLAVMRSEQGLSEPVCWLR